MTQITYTNGRLKIKQSEHEVDFKISDLTYESRQQLMNAIIEIEV